MVPGGRPSVPANSSRACSSAGFRVHSPSTVAGPCWILAEAGSLLQRGRNTRQCQLPPVLRQALRPRGVGRRGAEDPGRHLPFSPSQEKAISIWESENFFFDLEPLPGAVEAVKQMANLER